MKLPLLAICSALLCCSPAPASDCAPQCVHSGPDYRVCVDSELPADVANGVRMWASVLCDRSFSLQRIDGAADVPAECRATLLFAASEWDWIGAAGVNTLAFADPDRGLAWIIVDRVPAGLMRTVAAHELGHLLGIAQDSTGIMHDPAGPEQCITARNVEEVP